VFYRTVKVRRNLCVSLTWQCYHILYDSTYRETPSQWKVKTIGKSSCNVCVTSRTAYVSDSNRKQEKRNILGVSESKVPYFFATKILHIIRCVFTQLLLTTFTIFLRSHLLCWWTCLGGKSILRKHIDRRWTNEHVTMRAPHVPLLHCHAISWHSRPLASVCVCVVGLQY